MRLSLLVLNILIGASLSINAPDLAAAKSAKTGKSKSQILYQGHNTKKTPPNPGDVWTRIRLGMKIPNATAVQTGLPVKNDLAELDDLSNSSADSCNGLKKLEALAEKQALSKSTLDIDPPTAITPMRNATAIGRMRLSAKTTSTTSKYTPPSPDQFRQVNILKNKGTTAQENKKISSRMDFYPALPQRTGLVRLRSQLNTPSLNGKPALTTSTIRPDLRSLAKTATLAKPPCAALAEADKSRQAMINDRINKQIVSYTQNPGFIYRVAERARPYLYHILEGLSKNRLPLELALLPIVESAYQPTAQSPKNAAGLWQFIPSTGKDFNLEQSSVYDERLDIPESTQAAIRFLSRLKDHFKGDWLLALAAYNSGQLTVDNAISRNLAEGLPADFWSLRLPEETQNYVPRLLALANIFAHPASYGIKLPHVSNEPYFVKVKIDREFDINYLAEKDISTVAKLANLTHEQFSLLNPGHLSPTLSRNNSYTFLMPAHNAKQLRQSLASIAQFMADSTPSVKSVLLTENPQAKIYLPSSSMSVGSLLASSEVSDGSDCSTVFLSLKVSRFCSQYRTFSIAPDSTTTL